MKAAIFPCGASFSKQSFSKDDFPCGSKLRHDGSTMKAPALIRDEGASSLFGFSTKVMIFFPSSLATPKFSTSSLGVSAMMSGVPADKNSCSILEKFTSIKLSPHTKKKGLVRFLEANLTAPPVPSGSVSIAYDIDIPKELPSPKYSCTC